MNRTLVGLLALACLLAAGYLFFFSEAEQSSRTMMWSGAFVRVGLLTGAFWLALPTKTRDAAWAGVSPWQFVGGLLAIAAVAIRPRVAIPFLLALAVVGFFLRPRPKQRPPRR
ncbi:hypothetical protein [Thalassoroseus pseudoceratinae]|uniref:hypothetical protein n=1 Tax=Thalassoroseus pseudoceratinae TaxID=2713176 RepID=UPI0014246154|nr:hypothetical protein [Thalassoroseus pseudoceratinae]